MGNPNVYYRYQFIADLEDAFQLGEVNFPEWDALFVSWPVQIEAVFYGSATPEQAEAVEEACCVNCCVARDEAEDKTISGEEYVVGCSDPFRPEFVQLDPVEESRTYHYPEGGVVTVDGGVSAICIRESGYHMLETLDGGKCIVAPGWRAISIEADDWTF